MVSSRHPAADEDTEEILWGDGAGSRSVCEALYEDGEETLTNHVLAAEAFRAVDALPGRCGTMIRQWSMGWSFDEIGAFYGLTAERAGQIVRGGIADLRRALT